MMMIEKQYSSFAAPALRDTISAYKQGLSWSTADTFLARDMDAIIQNPQTTPREKVIATMAKKAGEAAGVAQKDSATLRYAAANAITATAGGSLAHALAGIVQDAWKAGLSWDGAAAITETALKTLVENSEPGSVESSLATATLNKTEGSAIPSADSARLRFDALKQIGKSTRRRWFSFGHKARPAAPEQPQPVQATLDSLISRLPQPLQARVADITHQAAGLVDGDSPLPVGSIDFYHADQIRGEFMQTAVKGYLEASAGSVDPERQQKVDRDFDLQLNMMKNQLDIFDKRYRGEAAERLSEHTRFLAESFGAPVP